VYKTESRLLPDFASKNCTSPFSKDAMPSSWPTETSVTIRNAILDALVDIDLKPKVEKPFINLSLGDPTFNPLLQPHKVALNAVAETLQSGKYNGAQQLTPLLLLDPRLSSIGDRLWASPWSS
jgi:hypothetical protein